ncbi:glycosyltransferase family 4 protein [candidate division WOR-3 bacterium]|nr:glycosyltransferase family 4 protein [candidate division WOR-3 bacterium]
MTRTQPAGTRPLRVCMVTDNYYPYIGGVAEHVHNLAAELRRRGHTVKVLTANSYGRALKAPDRMPGEGHVCRIGRGLLIPANKSFARLPVAWRPVGQVRAYFEHERFDVVHVHGSLAPTLPLAAIRAARCTRVMTFHAGHDASLGYSFSRSFLRPYFNALHGVIAVSDTARASHEKYFPGAYHVIPNGVDLEVFRPDARPPAGLPDRPRILFMGRIEPRKGLKYLLTALSEIVRHVPDVELAVVGAGPPGYSCRQYLGREVDGHVRWVGLVSGADRPGWLAASRVFCSPAVGNESFGIVLLEAMATARPVVASDIPGYRSVLTDGREGLLVPPKDPKSLAAALVRLLQDRQTAERIGAAGRRRALEFSWHRVAVEVEGFYEDLRGRCPVPRRGQGG